LASARATRSSGINKFAALRRELVQDRDERGGDLAGARGEVPPLRPAVQPDELAEPVARRDGVLQRALRRREERRVRDRLSWFQRDERGRAGEQRAARRCCSRLLQGSGQGNEQRPHYQGYVFGHDAVLA